MKKLFQVAIGYEEAGERYFAVVHSLTDGKHAPVTDTSMRRVMARVNKLVRDKTREVKHFPIPEPKRILTIAQGQPSIILVGANGRS